MHPALVNMDSRLRGNDEGPAGMTSPMDSCFRGNDEMACGNDDRLCYDVKIHLRSSDSVGRLPYINSPTR